MTGLETALAVVAHVLATDSGEVDWEQVASLTSANPARIGRIDHTAGRPLRVGEPATFALVDPHHDWSVTTAPTYSTSTNTPFPDLLFRHRVAATAIDGRLTHNELTGVAAPERRTPA